MILARAPSGHPSPRNQRSRPLRISRGEHARHRRTLGHTKNDRGFQTDCIHDRTNIVGSLLECGHLSRTVREPCPALIKTDQSADLSQFQKKIRAHRKLPIHVQMGKGPGYPNEVERTAAVNLVCNINVTALSVVSFRFHRFPGVRLSRAYFQTRNFRNGCVAGPPQSLWEAGQAGLGCKIWPTRGGSDVGLAALAITSRARFAAKSPTPMIHSGSRTRTISRKCSSHATNSAVRSTDGSLSGVRFRPLASTKASGQSFNT